MRRTAEFVKWYRLAESVLGTLVPHLTDDEIPQFVSNNEWLAIPKQYEVNKKDFIDRPDPSLYINLSRERRIGLGIVCNTFTSIKRMRNILHAFHSLEKEELVKRLDELDDGFMTTVERKIKEHHYTQTPVYEVDLEIPSNRVNSSSISEIFEGVKRILDEGRKARKQRGVRWPRIAPHLNLAITWFELNQDRFTEKLARLKPVYEIALRIRTNREIKEEETRLKKEQIDAKQKKFTVA